MSLMKITVTKADIEGGRRRDPHECAVARALRRAGLAHLGVMGMLVAVRTRRQQTSMFLPGFVQEWILDYDWGLPVQPIEFELAVPRSLQEKQRPQQRKRKRATALEELNAGKVER